MATRFMYKAFLTAALGITPSLLLPATTTASPTWSNTAGAPQLDPPAAPSNCRTKTTTIRDRRKGNYTFTTVSWSDNSSNEDGFTVEAWLHQSGTWVPFWSVNTPANSTSCPGVSGASIRHRVKAFNASGDSAWSNWAR